MSQKTCLATRISGLRVFRLRTIEVFAAFLPFKLLSILGKEYGSAIHR